MGAFMQPSHGCLLRPTDFVACVAGQGTYVWLFLAGCVRVYFFDRALVGVAVQHDVLMSAVMMHAHGSYASQGIAVGFCQPG